MKHCPGLGSAPVRSDGQILLRGVVTTAGGTLRTPVARMHRTARTRLQSVVEGFSIERPAAAGAPGGRVHDWQLPASPIPFSADSMISTHNDGDLYGPREPPTIGASAYSRAQSRQ